MIEFFSSWAKGIGVTVVIISIIEMLLPNNNSKKYIRMVLCIYLMFNIISPLIKNKDILNVNNIKLNETSISTSSEDVDQTSMNKRIKKLYEQELEKDITKKLKEKGFEVKSCNVATQVSTNENEETKINKIKVSIDKISVTNKIEEKNTESKIVNEIQKIKKIDTNIGEKKDEKQCEIDKTHHGDDPDAVRDAQFNGRLCPGLVHRLRGREGGGGGGESGRRGGRGGDREIGGQSACRGTCRALRAAGRRASQRSSAGTKDVLAFPCTSDKKKWDTIIYHISYQTLLSS